MGSVVFNEHKLKARLRLILSIARFLWAINFVIAVLATLLRHWELVVLAVMMGLPALVLSAVTLGVLNMVSTDESQLVISEYGNAGRTAHTEELYVEER